MKHKAQRLFALFLLISVTASAQTDWKRDLPPLQIKEQGSFAVGGTVITNPGKFDPYHPTPDGLGGNDDCGQMSAWYLFSALGFYPVAPGSGKYALGSPVIKTAVLELETGRTLTIRAEGQSERNIYVRSITLNGHRLDRRYITYDEIVSGGKLVFQMDDKPAN